MLCKFCKYANLTMDLALCPVNHFSIYQERQNHLGPGLERGTTLSQKCLVLWLYYLFIVYIIELTVNWVDAKYGTCEHKKVNNLELVLHAKQGSGRLQKICSHVNNQASQKRWGCKVRPIIKSSKPCPKSMRREESGCRWRGKIPGYRHQMVWPWMPTLTAEPTGGVLGSNAEESACSLDNPYTMGQW